MGVRLGTEYTVMVGNTKVWADINNYFKEFDIYKDAAKKQNIIKNFINEILKEANWEEGGSIITLGNILYVLSKIRIEEFKEDEINNLKEECIGLSIGYLNYFLNNGVRHPYINDLFGENNLNVLEGIGMIIEKSELEKEKRILKNDITEFIKIVTTDEQKGLIKSNVEKYLNINI